MLFNLKEDVYMRVEGELKRLFINKINSILRDGLETLPPIQEMILERSIDNERLALLVKYSDISSQRTNAYLFIFKSYCDDWFEDGYIFFENRIILSMCMNDLGDKIALSVQDLGIKLMSYDNDSNRWCIKDYFLSLKDTDIKDIFGHEILYDKKDNLLVSAPFRAVNEKPCAGIVYIFKDKELITTLQSKDIREDDFFGLSMIRGRHDNGHRNNTPCILIDSVNLKNQPFFLS